MRKTFLIIPILFSIVFFSCTISDKKVELTPEQITQLQIDTLKNTAQDGDLITRFNDNLVSFQVRNLNLRDRTFSHGGIVMTKNGQKVVCNIDANTEGMDTVRFDPIDSFINPQENFVCGLFRFNLSETERQDFLANLNAYHDKHAHFDKIFQMSTDSVVYCSEMIGKSLMKATHNRFQFQEAMIPRRMLKIVGKYLEPFASAELVAATKYIPVDALYLDTDCKELMRFKLKHFPGEEQSK
jgi:hypothetical protein